jgi:uncharacterized cofD-like protein
VTPPVRVVAFGGGHGLSASLRSLASLRDDGTELDITAVVTVADDGGSSGRLRAERGTLPPGDLRQALAALAAPDPHTGMVAALFQHRFAAPAGLPRDDGPDHLTGHPVGNLVLCGLFEMYDDPVAALAHAAEMVDARGRVLPMSPAAVSIEADVREASGQLRTVFGQHSVAVSSHHVEAVRLNPADPPPCQEAVHAVAAADWLIFGPGSWFTSVIPHLLVPDLAKSILSSTAKRLVILNLAEELETSGLSLSDHLDALTRYLPGLRADVVLADGEAVGDPVPVRRAAQSLGARLVLAPVARGDGTPRHDPSALASALLPLLCAT